MTAFQWDRIAGEVEENMGIEMSRRAFLGATGLMGAALLAGCSGGGSASSSASSGSAPITIGSLPTEDILPIWVARDEGLYEKAGLKVDVVPFQSAAELISGVQAGAVLLAMTDIMVTASIFAGGTDVQMEWITLGATPQQGRFGIMVGPESKVASLTDLAGVPIGVGTNTILEYVMDRLMEGAGIPDDQIVVEEMQDLLPRYQMMANGQVAAAALPASLLALGEATGCRTVADDTQGENISQSVMIARSSFVEGGSGSSSVETLKQVWNEAADKINADPEAYRATLVKNANLPEVVASTYPICEYPRCELPTNAMVDPVLAWMKKKGHLTKDLTYDQATGKFSA